MSETPSDGLARIGSVRVDWLRERGWADDDILGLAADWPTLTEEEMRDLALTAADLQPPVAKAAARRCQHPGGDPGLVAGSVPRRP